MIQFQEVRKMQVLYSHMHIVNSFHTFVFCACRDTIDFYSDDTLSSAYPAGGPALEPALMAGPFLHKVWRNIGHLVLTSTGTWAHQRTSWECCASCTSQQRCNPRHQSFFLVHVTVVLTSCSFIGKMCQNKASPAVNHLW